jgi:hypothetical protein
MVVSLWVRFLLGLVLRKSATESAKIKKAS